MQKFPKIISYLEQYRPDVFELFNNLGMQGDLNPKQKGSITFLCPSAELCENIKTVIEGPNPEDATDMLASLILTDLYTSPSNMSDGNVRTHLGKVLPIQRIGSRDIKLKNGASISPHIEPPFIPFARKGVAKRDNMAIWNYVGEMWDYENAEYADSNKPKKIVKSQNITGGSKAGTRKRLVKVVQAAASQYYCTNSNEFVGNDGVENPFIRASACILSNIRTDMQQVSEVMPFIFSPCRAIMFYSLATLVDENTLSYCNNWQNPNTPYDMNLINSVIDDYMDFSSSENPQSLMSTKEGQKQCYKTIVRLINDTPKSNLIHKKELQAIDKLINSNKLVNLQNVFSNVSHSAVRKHPNLFKLVNFASYQLVLQLEEATGSNDMQSINSILSSFNQYYTGSREAIAARVEGLESYDKMSNEFSNDDWQYVKRNRFCQSLLWSLPMHREVAAYFVEKLGDTNNAVSRKANYSNVVGSNDVSLSKSTRSELREYMRLKGKTPENLKDLMDF